MHDTLCATAYSSCPIINALLYATAAPTLEYTAAVEIVVDDGAHHSRDDGVAQGCGIASDTSTETTDDAYTFEV